MDRRGSILYNYWRDQLPSAAAIFGLACWLDRCHENIDWILSRRVSQKSIACNELIRDSLQTHFICFHKRRDLGISYVFYDYHYLGSYLYVFKFILFIQSLVYLI